MSASAAVVATVFAPLACVATAVLGLVVPGPPPSQHHGAAVQQQLSAVLWSALDECSGDGGGGAVGPAAVCLKRKALTALDHALDDPAISVAHGVWLIAQPARSPGADDPPRRAQRVSGLAAVDAAPDVDRKNALLDDMLASRLDEFVSTRAVVIGGKEDEEEEEEEEKGIILGKNHQTNVSGNSYTFHLSYSFSTPGKGEKKHNAWKKAFMLACLVAAAVTGSMIFSVISFISIKALLISKIALTLSGIVAIEKHLSPTQKNRHETVPVAHYNARNMQMKAHDMVYLVQKK